MSLPPLAQLLLASALITAVIASVPIFVPLALLGTAWAVVLLPALLS